MVNLTGIILTGWMFSAGIFPSAKLAPYSPYIGYGVQVQSYVSRRASGTIETAVEAYSNIPKDDTLYRGVISFGTILPVTKGYIYNELGYKVTKSNIQIAAPYAEIRIRLRY